MSGDSDSEEELRPINSVEIFASKCFSYEDPALLTGILRAVVEGDLDKVKYFISVGHCVNINDNNGNTPLHVAVIRNLKDIAAFLLTQDEIIINTRNFSGETPLFYAVQKEHIDIVNLLIEAGANVNLPNFEDVTPLHVAVKNPDIAHILIKNGANINATDYSGDTPLHEAVIEQVLETTCMLLYYNADANVPNDTHITPFMFSIIRQNIHLQEALFEFVDDFNTVSVDGMSVLALALTHYTPYLKQIIERGANVNYFSKAFHPIVLCASTGNPENFEIIWKHYKGVKSKDIEQIDALVALDPTTFKRFLEIIVKSGNVTPIVYSLEYQPSTYCVFVIRCKQAQVPLDLLHTFSCLLFCHNFQCCFADFSLVFALYGYCNLCKIMLHMNISMIDTGDIGLPLILCDIKHSVTDIMNKFTAQLGAEHLVGPLLEYAVLETLLRYIIYPQFNNKLKYLCSTENANFHMLKLKNKIEELPQIPSLLELARNASRDNIVNKFECINTTQFYTVVNYLNISQTFKKILNFETPIYT